MAADTPQPWRRQRWPLARHCQPGSHAAGWWLGWAQTRAGTSKRGGLHLQLNGKLVTHLDVPKSSSKRVPRVVRQLSAVNGQAGRRQAGLAKMRSDPRHALPRRLPPAWTAFGDGTQKHIYQFHYDIGCIGKFHPQCGAAANGAPMLVQKR